MGHFTTLDAVLAGPSEAASMATEATRVLEDRMMAIMLYLVIRDQHLKEDEVIKN